MPNSTQNDKQFLLEAIKLAENGKFTCHPNPMVGCVLVKDGVNVSSGWHQKAGEAHAEVNAIANAEQNGVSLNGATAYVSLEPCSFTGKTPPCVDALIHAGVSRVVCATLDPNPKVAGNGLSLLQEANIEAVVLDDAEVYSKAEWLNKGFFKRMREGKPWVMLKTASSLDGKTADNQGLSQWITSEQARQDVHRLRAMNGAVLTGSGTQQADNPSLNARLSEQEFVYQQPLRVLLDSQCKLTPDAKIVSHNDRDENSNKNRKDLLVFTTQTDSKILKSFSNNIEFSIMESIELETVLQKLAAKQINQVMIEAGAHLSGAFLEADLVDEIVHYIAPSVIGSGGRAMFDFSTNLSLSEKKQFTTKTVEQIGNDIKVVYVRDSYLDS